MNNYRQLYILLWLLLLQFQLIGQEEWSMSKDKDGIQVFTRSNKVSSFKEFRATMEIEAGLNEFLAVIYDIDGLSDWGYNIKESKLLDRPNDLIQTYYAVAKAPWPYKDRDGVYVNRINWNQDTRTLRVEIEMLELDIEKANGYVRMDGYGFWQIKEIANGKLEVNFQMQVDPGGSIKAWMANMFVTDSPYYTMKGLRDIIGEKKYQDKKYDFLKN